MTMATKVLSSFPPMVIGLVLAATVNAPPVASDVADNRTVYQVLVDSGYDDEIAAQFYVRTTRFHVAHLLLDSVVCEENNNEGHNDKTFTAFVNQLVNLDNVKCGSQEGYDVQHISKNLEEFLVCTRKKAGIGTLHCMFRLVRPFIPKGSKSQNSSIKLMEPEGQPTTKKPFQGAESPESPELSELEDSKESADLAQSTQFQNSNEGLDETEPTQDYVKSRKYKESTYTNERPAKTIFRPDIRENSQRSTEWQKIHEAAKDKFWFDILSKRNLIFSKREKLTGRKDIPDSLLNWSQTNQTA